MIDTERTAWFDLVLGGYATYHGIDQHGEPIIGYTARLAELAREVLQPAGKVLCWETPEPIARSRVSPWVASIVIAAVCMLLAACAWTLT
jgi:hypothetical protein